MTPIPDCPALGGAFVNLAYINAPFFKNGKSLILCLSSILSDFPSYVYKTKSVGPCPKALPTYFINNIPLILSLQMSLHN